MYSSTKKFVKLPCPFGVSVEGGSRLVAVGDGNAGGVSVGLVESL